MNLEKLFASAPSVRVVAKKSVLSENFENNRCVFDAIIRDTRVFVFEHHNKKSKFILCFTLCSHLNT